MRFVIYLSLTLFILSCSNSKDSNLSQNIPNNYTTPVLAENFSIIGDYKSLWPESWTQIVYEALESQNSELLHISPSTSDLAFLSCQNYHEFSRAQKKKFWTIFLASISHFESSFNPRTRYWESTMNKYSEGLFQLSVDDSANYDYCDLSSDTILNPLENISCGVNILEKQLRGGYSREPGRLFPPRSFYWSVLTSAKSKQKVRLFFKKRASKHLEECSRSI
ncbi:transglycosylase SLT domain-containing protein [Halobacteriovorax sp. HLS]|uniref:transglycosylase SLT domain-containing protein n=1 Tax=Halobacteriovorax sp. HLS TaxID=2234000 RepID=UPI000FDBCCEE|nr:transglycosylase SLT domain-containing protein [Halobacteriovorax sp. HLS]